MVDLTLPPNIYRFSRSILSAHVELAFVAVFLVGVLFVVILLDKHHWDDTNNLLIVTIFGLILLTWGWFLSLCYQVKLSRDWQRRIVEACKDVAEDAAFKTNDEEADGMFHSAACLSADFFGSYTDSQKMNGRELLSSTGILNIVADGSLEKTHEETEDAMKAIVLPTDPLGEDASLSHCRCITGRGENERGDFSIAVGRLSPSSGKCWWMERPITCSGADAASSRITRSNINEATLVTGAIVRDKGTGRPVVRGRWTTRSKREGTLFLRLNGRPVDTEKSSNVATSREQKDPQGSLPNDDYSDLEFEPLVHRHRTSAMETDGPQTLPTHSSEQPRVLVIYDETIEALLKAPKKKKSQR